MESLPCGNTGHQDIRTFPSDVIAVAPTTNTALPRTLPPHLLVIRQRLQHARTQFATIVTNIRRSFSGRSGAS
jgi:hypothetical protein